MLIEIVSTRTRSCKNFDRHFSPHGSRWAVHIICYLVCMMQEEFHLSIGIFVTALLTVGGLAGNEEYLDCGTMKVSLGKLGLYRARVPGETSF